MKPKSVWLMLVAAAALSLGILLSAQDATSVGGETEAGKPPRKEERDE